MKVVGLKPQLKGFDCETCGFNDTLSGRIVELAVKFAAVCACPPCVKGTLIPVVLAPALKLFITSEKLQVPFGASTVPLVHPKLEIIAKSVELLSVI